VILAMKRRRVVKADQTQLAGALGELIEVLENLFLTGRQKLGEEEVLHLLFGVVKSAEGGKESEANRNQGHSGQEGRVREPRGTNDHFVAIELTPGRLHELDETNPGPLPGRKRTDIETVEVVDDSHDSSTYYDSPNLLGSRSGRMNRP
jgi:hypothetical protein